MRILLVQPPKGRASLAGEAFYVFEPLALEMLAAVVRPHHDVELVDLRLDADFQGPLERFRPDVVGVTAYTVNVHPALEICAAVKAWNPRCLTVVGGHHATVRPEDFARPSVDLVVQGDGQDPFRCIVERRERGEGFENRRRAAGRGRNAGRYPSLGRRPARWPAARRSLCQRRLPETLLLGVDEAARHDPHVAGLSVPLHVLRALAAHRVRHDRRVHGALVARGGAGDDVVRLLRRHRQRRRQ